MECILDDLLHDSNVFEMTTILAQNSRNKLVKAHQNLSVKLNIICEEVFGLESCTISLHNLIHIHEDVLKFGVTDNFWCATFERAVKNYISRPTNKMGLEKIYAHSEE